MKGRCQQSWGGHSGGLSAFPPQCLHNSKLIEMHQEKQNIEFLSFCIVYWRLYWNSHLLFKVSFFFLTILGIEAMSLNMQGECSATEPFSPQNFLFSEIQANYFLQTEFWINHRVKIKLKQAIYL